MTRLIPPGAVLIPKSAKKVFEGVIFDVYHWDQEMFDGSSEVYEMLRRQDGMNIIAIKDDKIVLLNEEQPTMKRGLTLPGGHREPDDPSEEVCARREMEEETGMVFSDYRLVNIIQPSSRIDWFIYTFVATGFESQGDQKLDAGEKIDVQLFDFAEVKQASVGNILLSPMVFENVNSIEDLINLPEFNAEQVDD